MALIVKPPAKYDATGKYVIFLAGTIDQGKAEDWQALVGKFLQKFGDWLLVLDPRREDWDESWEQDIDNPEFKGQVDWELSAQERANLIIFVFATNEENAEKAKAPITLMELGLFKDKSCVVCCPEGYYRKGNVDIVCERYGVPVYENFEEMLNDVADSLAKQTRGRD